jgi:ADP-ribose pyrophosphatase YjhB (NUDIX family)
MVTERLDFDGREVLLTWKPEMRMSGSEEVTQVSGLCVTADRKVLLVSQDGMFWTLPGGHPEPGETHEETLAREVLEEACARVIACHYIGAQRVDDPARPQRHFQLRFLAQVELEPFLPRHEVRYRKLVDMVEAQELLWGGGSRIAGLLLKTVDTVGNEPGETHS